MGGAPRSSVAPMQERLIQLLLAEELLDEQKRPQLTEHVLGVLQRNARVAGKPVPKAIEITATEILHGHKTACGAGEKLVNINYEVVL